MTPPFPIYSMSMLLLLLVWAKRMVVPPTLISSWEIKDVESLGMSSIEGKIS